MTTKNEKLPISQSEMAREASVKPSFIKQLINDKRIPEAVRDPEHGNNYRMPNRRCVIPSRYPRRSGKINKFFFRRDEVPEEWITDPETRPGTVDENGDFVGTRLEGKEDELLSSRIARTFGVEVDATEKNGANRSESILPNIANVEDWRELGIDLETLGSSGVVEEITVRFARTGGTLDLKAEVSVLLSG